MVVGYIVAPCTCKVLGMEDAWGRAVLWLRIRERYHAFSVPCPKDTPEGYANGNLGWRPDQDGGWSGVTQ
jgi:hypothetical protein